jgi:hypothetical protein
MISNARLLRRCWPDRSIDLLVKAAVLSIKDARAAWTRWKASHEFDDASWHDARLFSALSLRIAELDGTSPLRPRIEGLARAHWTRTQFTLKESLEAVELIGRAGIPCLLIKGAAQYAEGHGAATRRVLGDIDVLVRAEHVVEAINVLMDAGWSGTFGESAGYLRTLGDLRISTNLLKGDYGEVDIHRTPFHYRCFDPAADALLWAGSRPALLNGQQVMVPSPAASVLISLAHSIQGEGGDWALDVAQRLKHQAIEWDCLIELATRWRLTLPAWCALSYLTRELALPVPPEVLDRLSGVRADWAERLKLWSNVREPVGRPLSDRIGNRIANEVLARRGYDLAVADEERLPVMQPLCATTARDALNYVLPGRRRLIIMPPRPLAALRLRRAKTAIAASPDAATWTTQATLPLRSSDQVARLGIELEFVVPDRARWIYFDLARGKEAFARIRARAGGRRAGTIRRIVALVRVPSGSLGDVSIEARPTKFIRPTATAKVLELARALPFRLVRVVPLGPC